jgi:hypothetical protein
VDTQREAVRAPPRARRSKPSVPVARSRRRSAALDATFALAEAPCVTNFACAISTGQSVTACAVRNSQRVDDDASSVLRSTV